MSSRSTSGPAACSPSSSCRSSRGRSHSIFPPSWALDALRYLAIPGYQGFAWGFWGDLAGALGTTAVYLAIAGTIFRRVERQVLEKGNLSDY